jgi:hypothetical protein
MEFRLTNIVMSVVRSLFIGWVQLFVDVSQMVLDNFPRGHTALSTALSLSIQRLRKEQ